MPDVSSTVPAFVRLWVALDVHKHSIVAATLPPSGVTPQLQRIENSERAIRRLIDRLGGPNGLAVAYEAGARVAMTCCGCSAAWAWRAT